MELTELKMKRAAEIASRIGVRGMDAIVIQIAEETGSVLVTLDEEMMKAAKQTLPLHSTPSPLPSFFFPIKRGDITTLGMLFELHAGLGQGNVGRDRCE